MAGAVDDSTINIVVVIIIIIIHMDGDSCIVRGLVMATELIHSMHVNHPRSQPANLLT